MREWAGDIWDYYDQGHWIVIPVNGEIKRGWNGDAEAIMGAGLAKQAVERIPLIARILGMHMEGHGSQVAPLWPERVIAFPSKYRWRDKSNMQLIATSTQEMLKWTDSLGAQNDIYLPRIGCGERTGQLQWEDVGDYLGRHLDDRFTVVTLPGDV